MAETGSAESAQDKGRAFVKANFADAIVSEGEFNGQCWVTVEADKVHDVVAALKNEGGFDMLEDMTAVDYLDRPEVEGRFRVVYHLFSLESKGIFRLKAFVDDEDDEVPTVSDLFAGANWLEREIYDMFGIPFTDHPDLRRILMPEEWEGFPCRRDYPWHGRIPITDPMRERDFDKKTVEES